MIAKQTDVLKLRVAEADSEDVGRSLVRMDPEAMRTLGLKIGDVVRFYGKASGLGKVMPTKPSVRGKGVIQIDGIGRDVAQCAVDASVRVEPAAVKPADEVVLRPRTVRPLERDLDHLASLLDGRPVEVGAVVRVTLFANDAAEFRVESSQPSGPVVVHPQTRLRIEGGDGESWQRAPCYEDIGGAYDQMQRIRELIELPLRCPELFERLGIDPPKGVLMYGPPGCGKTLIARTIASETDAKFFSISGPEVIHKFYGESEAHLRKIFSEAAKQAPSIIFLDEIDAIAPRRENAAGDVERRVVAQLLALMDGLSRRENVVVIAATNLPNAIDPALRRPGRFDREIEIPIPDRRGRRQILQIHSRGMPLTSCVDLDHLASVTHGFVGADLAALCREAAMNRLRAVMGRLDFTLERVSFAQLAELAVSMDDFLSGLRSIEPSAIREVFVEVPQTRWRDIGGLESIKQLLREAVIWPLRYGPLFERAGVRPPRGILLAGPPGCGKTMLAKAIATESRVNFISVKGPEVLSKFIGDSEKAIREIFTKARQAAPCVIFFDEIDGLCPVRQSGQADAGVANRVLSQFLAELDGVEELNDVFVLAATNRPDVVDPALRRFGRLEQTLEIGLPDPDSRRQILDVHLSGKPLADDVDLGELVAKSEGWSGAEIAGMCHQAARTAIRRAVKSLGDSEGEMSVEQVPQLEALELTISLADLRSAIEKAHPGRAKISDMDESDRLNRGEQA